MIDVFIKLIIDALEDKLNGFPRHADMCMCAALGAMAPNASVCVKSP